VDCVAIPGPEGDGFLPDMGPFPVTIEISQAHGQSPEMEFLADRTALLCQRKLGGLLEHGESGREFRSWNRFASYLSEKVYSWPAHLQRRIRHHFGTDDALFESNIEIKGEAIDLALFPPRVSHDPSNAIWVFLLAERGDRQARRRLRRLLRRNRHLRRGVLVAGDGLRCYERRHYPDGPRADRIPFSDLALTPDATFGLVGDDEEPVAFQGAPLGLRDFVEAVGPELVDRRFVVLDIDTGGQPMAEAMNAAGIVAEEGEGDTAILDFPALMRLRLLPSLSTSRLAFADLAPDTDAPKVERGRPAEPAAVLAETGGDLVYVGKDDVLLTVHARARRHALRLCAYSLRRYLRYYRPDHVTAHSPTADVVEQLREHLENRYVILPEDGPREEGAAIALDLYRSRSLWRGMAHGSPERAVRVIFEPEGGVWSVRELG